MKITHILAAPGFYVIEPVKLEQKAGALVVTSETDRSIAQLGRIINVGKDRPHDSGRLEVTPHFAKGDLVTYKPYSGHTLKAGTAEFVMVAFNDVMGLVVMEESN